MKDRLPDDQPSGDVVYCVIPRELAALEDSLRRHFRDDPGVVVIRERRNGDRRSGAERRVRDEGAPASGDRRRIRNADGRRVAERRAEVEPVPPPPDLPRRVRRHTEGLTAS